MSRPIYREEALRRYADPATRESKPLVIRRRWFVLLWGLVMVLLAIGGGLALVVASGISS
ncbi:hypothetical protein EDD27_9683 [Nonomuraea polychroma]|uniref:Uncharacterized protein n=1 Tax=Nonomuraea polychroma TaxID=46176 RepID=A0A438MLY3_9ACTN|nr:hypothetical protein [Nonomuraea polychroma]RVX46780.1 hypothetical protein EDD27_9683 [Nonomuraea polychroma]